MKRVTVASTLTTLATICFFIIILSGKHCDECFSAPVMMAKFIACGLVIFIGSLYFTRVFLKNEKEIFTIETSPLLETDEAVDGLPFSCEGTVYADESHILRSPYTDMPCVYYHSITEKKFGSGKNSRWEITENLLAYSPFYISDSRGKIKIDPTNIDSDFSGFKLEEDHTVPDPDNSEIDCTRVLDRSTFGIPNESVSLFDTGSTVRRSEYILPPLVKIFAYGYISKTDTGLVLREHQQYPLIISQKTKDAFVNEFYKGQSLVFLVHILIAIGFTITILAANYFMHTSSVLLVNTLIIGNALLVSSMVFSVYNRLITLSVRAKNAEHDIEIELKRRSDLIPEITTLVKTYAQYEQEVIRLVSQLRTHISYVSTLQEANAENVRPLLALAEKYPTITSDKNFRRLMLTLRDTEERIAYARSFYNRNVRKLDTLVGQFPFNLIAVCCGIRSMPFISVSEG